MFSLFLTFWNFLKFDNFTFALLFILDEKSTLFFSQKKNKRFKNQELTSLVSDSDAVNFNCTSNPFNLNQVHKESIQLVENVFNENLYKKPYLRNWLPEKESVNKVYQEAVNNLYFYGREWLTERLKTTSYNTTTADGMVLEKQLLKQWDVIYTYLSRNSTKALTSVTAESRSLAIETMVLSQTKPDPKNSTLEVSNWEKMGKNLKRMMSFMNGRDSFDYQYFAVIFKDNLGTVYAILESTYRILKGKHFNKS